MHRDNEINIKFMCELGNDERFFLRYAGVGDATESLKYKASTINNVSFTGKYLKEDEGNIVDECDLINIMLSDDMLSKHLISNRFYLSLMHKKPMIVNQSSYQAYLVNKYGVGIVVNLGENVAEKIIQYIKDLNTEDYVKNVDLITKKIAEDISHFEEKVRIVLGN